MQRFMHYITEVLIELIKEGDIMLTVLGVIFLILIFGVLFFTIGIRIIQAVGGLVGAVLGLCSIIGLIILIACII